MGHVGFEFGPDWTMHFIWQSHDHQFRRGDRSVKADRKEAIRFRKASTRAAPSPHRDRCSGISQIQRMGSSLIAVAQDGDSEPGWISI